MDVQVSVDMAPLFCFIPTAASAQWGLLGGRSGSLNVFVCVSELGGGHPRPSQMI
jgi:hypothetical protein